MFKLLKFYLIYRVSKDAVIAARIYNMLYHTDIDSKNFIKTKNTDDKKIKVEEQTNSNGNKKEIIDSLNYLKSKPNKTKQDRESIYTLEMVLKNMK